MANTATSIYLDGSADDYIETGISFASYGGEFTLEGWFLPSQSGTREGLFGAGNTDDIQVDFRTNNNLIFFARQSDGTTYACNLTISAADIAPRQAWQHLAFCRIGDRGAVFHNGVLKGIEASYSFDSHPSDMQEIRVGSYADTINFNGYMDAVRISKTARYGNFKAPTAVLDVKQTASIGMNTLKPENVTVLLQADNNTANGTYIGSGNTRNRGSGGGEIQAHNGTPKIVTTEHLPWKNTSFLINGSTDRWYLGSGTDPEPFASFGYDDFSIEGWFKNTAPTGTGYNMPLRATYNGGPGSNWYINIAGTNTTGATSTTHFYYYDSPAVAVSEVTRHDAGDFSEWTHLAIVRENRDKICMFSNDSVFL